MKFDSYKFSEITINFDSKRIPLSSKQRSNKQGIYPYYGAQGIIDYVDDFIFDGKFLLIAEDGENLKSRKQKIAQLANGKFWVNNHAHIIQTNEKCILEYLYYVFNTLDISGYITGSAQPKLSQSNLNAIVINLPSIEAQKKIVSILSALDEKIALNQQINNNLEQQAQAIFKSWFVDFEPFDGKQPLEMQFVPLQDLCKVITKGTTPTTLGKTFTNFGINFIKAESISDNHSIDSRKFAYIDEETNTMLKRSIIEANDIIFTIAGTLGRFALVDDSVLPANTNQAVAIIRPDTNKVTPHYLYSFFIGNWHNDYYSKRVQQAVQANLSLTTIKSLPIPVMNTDEMSKYNEMVSPLFALMKSNEAENCTLAQLRDSLLPKLMSDELDVSDIDI